MALPIIVHDLVIVVIAGVFICLFELYLFQFTRSEERKRTEIGEERRHFEAMLSTVIETIPDLVFIKDLEGKHILVNKAVEEFTGLSRKELLSTSYKHLPPELAAACTDSDKRSFLTPISNRF